MKIKWSKANWNKKLYWDQTFDPKSLKQTQLDSENSSLVALQKDSTGPSGGRS